MADAVLIDRPEPDSPAPLGLLDETGLADLARALAAEARPGAPILLRGPLGAGKSHFARAFIRARLNSPHEDVPSPTFTLVQSYDHPDGDIWHADLYRLAAAAELDELGLSDALERDICLVEWPERLAETGETLPPALTLHLDHADDPGLRRVGLSGDPALLATASRAAERAVFVSGAGWAGADLRPLAGDASSRRYWRLRRPDGRSAVLMDDRPEALPPFLRMTDWLHAHGFHAPEILAQDAARGLLLLEDMGDAQMARVLDQQPDRAQELYGRVAELCAGIASLPPPGFVPRLDGTGLAEQVALFAEYYPPAAGATDEALAAAAQIAPTIAMLHVKLCADAAPRLALRDLHAENIMVAPDGRLGLLDYQDAVATHPAYDLASVLHDARRAVPPEVEQAAIARFLRLTGMDETGFRAAFALVAAQRNLRIMGIFARLCLRDGKPRYLTFMPHVWSLIRREIAHPALAPLAELVRVQPAPSPDVIERIAARCRR